MEPALAELEERLGKLSDLRRAELVLVWDMTVWMPPAGRARARPSSQRSKR